MMQTAVEHLPGSATVTATIADAHALVKIATGIVAKASLNSVDPTAVAVFRALAASNALLARAVYSK